MLGIGWEGEEKGGEVKMVSDTILSSLTFEPCEHISYSKS